MLLYTSNIDNVLYFCIKLLNKINKSILLGLFKFARIESPNDLNANFSSLFDKGVGLLFTVKTLFLFIELFIILGLLLLSISISVFELLLVLVILFVIDVFFSSFSSFVSFVFVFFL
jgi:hypothetical protein